MIRTNDITKNFDKLFHKYIIFIKAQYLIGQK